MTPHEEFLIRALSNDEEHQEGMTKMQIEIEVQKQIYRNLMIIKAGRDSLRRTVCLLLTVAILSMVLNIVLLIAK